MKLIPFSSASAQRGVVLIEAMVAILLFSVGVLAISGLQASMLQNASDTKYRTEASYIAQQVVGQMWVAPTITDFVKDNVDISSQLPGGRLSVVGTQTNVYQIIVGWTAPGETATTELAAPCNVISAAHCFSTIATVTPLKITP